VGANFLNSPTNKIIGGNLKMKITKRTKNIVMVVCLVAILAAGVCTTKGTVVIGGIVTTQVIDPPIN